jgi:hypothetical protein
MNSCKDGKGHWQILTGYASSSGESMYFQVRWRLFLWKFQALNLTIKIIVDRKGSMDDIEVNG